MKRRKFGLLAGSSLAAAATVAPARPVLAQGNSPDPNLLKTTLTPMGGERAGNADGSIPAWTGGAVLPPLGPHAPQDFPMFQDEAALYTVNAENMAQYSDLLSDGVKALMTKYGFWIKVYPTHRTAAMPQYVYDNTALNVSRAMLEPTGGRFGFTGAYGGIPFPIINTSDPLAGGAQLIWNHLTNWSGYANNSTFNPGWVVTNGNAVLVFGGEVRFVSPYYDPNGSLETYDGYLSKIHEWGKAPPASDGQEVIVWHTSNTLVAPDITWSLVNGQGRVRMAPDEAYDTPNPNTNGISNFDDSECFYGSPQKYDWKLLGKKEMLVPYNGNAITQALASDWVKPGFPNPDITRWEKHRVWVVEATLHPGERNTTARRMCYLDEDMYLIMYTDMYDRNGTMVKTAMNFTKCLPHLPGVVTNGYALWRMDSGDYTVIGYPKCPPYVVEEYFGPESPSYFSPQQMAASASF